MSEEIEKYVNLVAGTMKDNVSFIFKKENIYAKRTLYKIEQLNVNVTSLADF